MNMTDKARDILITMLGIGQMGKHLTMTNSGYAEASNTDFASCQFSAGLTDFIEGQILADGYIKVAPGTYLPTRRLSFAASVVTVARDGDVINVTVVVCGSVASAKVAA